MLPSGSAHRRKGAVFNSGVGVLPTQGGEGGRHPRRFHAAVLPAGWPTSTAAGRKQVPSCPIPHPLFYLFSCGFCLVLLFFFFNKIYLNKAIAGKAEPGYVANSSNFPPSFPNPQKCNTKPGSAIYWLFGLMASLTDSAHPCATAAGGGLLSLVQSRALVPPVGSGMRDARAVLLHLPTRHSPVLFPFTFLPCHPSLPCLSVTLPPRLSPSCDEGREKWAVYTRQTPGRSGTWDKLTKCEKLECINLRALNHHAAALIQK